MAFQISIGDVVLLGQIAWKLAQAFTNGSALKALSDAQNRNLALTTNGSSVVSLAGQAEENARWDTIRTILNSCYETLRRLESFTEKYGIVVDASDPLIPRSKRWREDLLKQWKKVTWTKEAGALATLRSQIAIHTDSLNLTLGVINNSQTARIESGVRETSTILKEIHAWYTDNLKDVEAIPRPHGTPQEIDSPQRRSFTDSPIHTFELMVGEDDGQKPLCGYASLRPDRGEEFDDIGTDSRRALMSPVLSGGELTHTTFNEDNHALALIGELKKARSTVESVTFAVGHRSISRDWVEDVQILLYSVHNNTHSWDTTGDTFRPLDFAEILIIFCEDNQGADNDVERTALKFKHDTLISLDKDDLTVKVTGVESTGFYTNGRTTRLEKHGSVEEFHAKLEGMREELFVLNLNYPRPDETVVLHLQSAQVECEEIFIVDASITVVHDWHGKYRLIIVSRNKCTVLSQVLADEFFSPPTGRPSFASPTWLVQIEGNGVRRIYYRQNGFRFPDLRSTQYRLLQASAQLS
ncbi:hypothetical protein DL766_003661 [Monosporascus sp. MC13-8B]|uniref:Fungal N-terminal domain-containing protein n=1 Tax=Monosporascus cannonballus TaxID=155416 RepID=A0ABY0GY83_9PEZI|nr:hypothetical protein DL762_007755 [Monosporascus cannonballus]RYO93634.1 hypothetical protein DL763_004309 [Monosporascus cannonballus]RYP33068.1 hypothetical protein DL766_003661 [Monosporascus sp. MC13-8B]